MCEDFDRFMHDYRTDPDREFAASLHARLAHMDTQAEQSRQRGLLGRLLRRTGYETYGSDQKGPLMKPRSPWKIRLVVTMLAIAFFVAIPPLRALATDILQQLGVLTITNAPTVVEQELATRPEDREKNLPSVGLDGFSSVGAAQVSAAAGFPVYEPQYLPEGGRLFDWESIRIEDPTPRAAIISMYQISTKPTYLTLTQQPQSSLTSDEIQVGSATTQKVMVGSNEAIWIERIALAKTGPNNEELAYVNGLMWQADGYHFWLSGDTDTSLETLKSFAESLAPGQ
ncbi:MAG: DUF4367 domain-containing protein [Herpetosiphonaceae bacterium]|nr:DUF4367 domain-containing protein [Herpetosiphonaceae bacterium]